MEKQEVTEEIDLTRWLLVHEQPHIAWLGEVSAGRLVTHGRVAELTTGSIVELHQACVLQSHDMMVPGAGGKPQQMRNTVLLPIHGFVHEVPVTVQVTSAVTWCHSLHPDDQQELRRMIQMHRDTMQRRRAQKLGLVT